MAISTGQQVAGVTATPIDSIYTAWSHIHIRNNENAKNLYIGGPDVTATTGLLINGLETIDFDIPPGDQFYIITDTGTTSISWLRINH